MREKTSLRMKNRVLSEEQKEKLRNIRLGVKATNETKDKMRLSSYIGWEKRKKKNI